MMPGQCRPQMVFDLIIQASKEPVNDDPALDVHRRVDLPRTKPVAVPHGFLHLFQWVVIQEHDNGNPKPAQALRDEEKGQARQDAGHVTEQKCPFQNPMQSQPHSLLCVLALVIYILCICLVCHNRQNTLEAPNESEGCDGGEEIVLLPLDELPRRGPGVFDVLRGPGQHRQVVDVRVVPLHVRGGVMAVVPVLPPSLGVSLHHIAK
mmetsp:Transcript_79360/g.132908  ORF Transcript_79360/g.132908 Transcript_79360/m.132908 type:complete len:207 (-) Transcript_79360:511-1131(-)